MSQDTFYVDPLKEAKKLGINVVADSVSAPVLKKNESGAIIKQDNGDIIIYVNRNDTPERQRFTIAHELGHYICGHLDDSTKMLRDSSITYTRDNFDLKEYEANKYAAELLMPKSKVDFLLDHEDIHTIEDMAKALFVSPTAMAIRLKNLGYIS